MASGGQSEDDSMQCEEENSAALDGGGNTGKNVYLPGDPIEDDEELVRDENAYIMYHEAQTGSPCLSFDIVRDKLGDRREEFPLTCYVVAGTQSERGQKNYVLVMRMSNLCKTQREEDDDEDDEDNDDEDEKPELEMLTINHAGCINRIKATTVQDTCLAATWSETGTVHIFNLQTPLNCVDNSQAMADYLSRQESDIPLFSSVHAVEGYALDWNCLSPGILVAGDCSKNIHLWEPQEGGHWKYRGPYPGHTNSVEDIQWSPTEKNVFASCSVDRTIRFWDNRADPKKACMITIEEAHLRDVNVIHWNPKETHFLLSGSDDNSIKIWDLRQIKQQKPIGVFTFHKGSITSVEWNPADSSVFAASGSDNLVTLWDLSLERDDSEVEQDPSLADIPQQLLFTHEGQNDIKELHWHPQLPGVIITTALSGFNIFKTISA